MDADAEYRKSKLRTSKCAAGADLCPVGGVVAGAALVQGATVQEGEHAAPRRRAAANHSSASPSSQSQLSITIQPANHSSPGRLQGGHEALLRHRQLAGQPGRCDIQEISLYPLQIKALLLFPTSIFLTLYLIYSLMCEAFHVLNVS